MLRYGFAVFSALALASFLSGCGGGSGVPETTLQTRIRAVNLIADAGPISLTADSTLVASGLSFENASDFQNIGDAGHEFRVTTAGGSALSDVNTSLLKGTDYSYIVAGSVAVPIPLALGTNPNLPTPGNFTLRVSNASAVTGALDVYVAPPGTSPGNSIVTAPSLGNGTSTVFITFAAGTYEIIATLAGTTQVVYASGPISFSDAVSADAVLYNRASGTLVNLALINADRAGGVNIIQNPLAQIKVVNAVAGSSPLNVFLNGSSIFTNVPFASASSYQSVPAGTRQLTVQSSTTPGANLLSRALSLSGATDNTVVLTGTPGALGSLVLNDNNLPPTPGNARVRVVNVSSDSSLVDVYVNFAREFAALAVNTASPYLEFPDGTYQLDFNLSGTAANILDVPALRLSAGATYSIYLVGPSGSAQAVVTRN